MLQVCQDNPINPKLEFQKEQKMFQVFQENQTSSQVGRMLKIKTYQTGDR